MIGLFWAIVGRDLRLALRHGADTMGAILFFIVTATLFPLALGPSPELLRHMPRALSGSAPYWQLCSH